MIKLYFICFVHFLVVSYVSCKQDYHFNLEAGGWFKLHDVPATWEEAFLRCHYEGAVLASPLNKEITSVLTFIMTQAGLPSKNQIYLGIHDLYSKGDFASVEGVPLSDMHIKWSAMEHKGDIGSCMTMDIDGSCTVISSCKERLPYICYRKYTNESVNECGTFDDDYRFIQRNGRCYKLHRDPQTWSRAYRRCAAEGAHLVVLNDDKEARIVKELFPPGTRKEADWDAFFIGLKAWGEGRTWITIHGESVESVYHGWLPGQPDNYQNSQSCATLLRVGTLDDNVCNSKQMFVCEKSPSTRYEYVPPGLEVVSN